MAFGAQSRRGRTLSIWMLALLVVACAAEDPPSAAVEETNGAAPAPAAVVEQFGENDPGTAGVGEATPLPLDTAVAQAVA